VYHWPLFLLLDQQHTGMSGVPLGVIRLAATAVVAGASYRWLEQPIRQQRWHLPRLALPAAPVIPASLVVAAFLVAGDAPARAVAPVTAHPVVLAQPTAGAATQSANARATTLPADPAAAPPLRRVLFMGDSLVQQALPTLTARLRSLGVETDAVGGGGVSLMSNHARVLADLSRAVAAFDPDVVVLESCCGLFATDAPWLGPTGVPLPRNSPALYEDWRTLAGQATTIARSRGAVVLWVLGPPLHTNGWYGPIDSQVARVNPIYLALIGCTPGAGAVDWRVLSAPGGQFAAALPDATGHLVTIRMSDGFHFTPAGWDAQARVTIAAVTSQWTADGGRVTTPVPSAASCGS
jgi:hypothetical protein